MVQVAMLLAAFPAGLLSRTRRAAYLVTASVFVIVSILQVMTTPQRSEAAYWVVQAITVLVAYGLVRSGAAVGTRRRATRSVA